MLRGKINLFLVLAVFFGFVAAYGVYAYLQEIKSTYQSAGDFQPVVVARENIPPRTKVTESMLEVREVPFNYIHKEALASMKEAVEKITTTEICQGEQILKTKLAGPKELSRGLSYMVENGKRAVSIAVNDVSGVAGLLKPGDKVDAVGTVDVPEGGAKVTVTSLILQNVPVLAVNQSAGEGPVKNADGSLQNRTVTLEVSLQQAQLLILAAERGSVRLVLRPPGDGTEVALPSARLGNLAR